MSRQRSLAIFLGDLTGSEEGLQEEFERWAAADLLESVALVDVDQATRGLATPATFVRGGVTEQLELSRVLILAQWDQVTIVSLRAGALDREPTSRWVDEVNLCSQVQRVFLSLEVESATVNIAQIGGSFDPGMFDAYWGVHLLHGTEQIIDSRVATLPVEDSHHVGLCLMVASIVSGALRWLDGRVMPLRDRTLDNEKPIRLGRAQLRVVNAGKLLAEVLDGAFPESGPWTTPPGVDAIQAISGTPIPQQLIAAVGEAGGFRVRGFSSVARTGKRSNGFFKDLFLWFEEWVRVVKGLPQHLTNEVLDAVGGRIERFAQRMTYGSDSDVVLKFRPGQAGIRAKEVVDLLYQEEIPDLAPSVVPDPAPWVTLRQSAFALADGGEFPTGIPAPSQDGRRLLFVDPWTIGPSPSDESFALNALERGVLGLPDTIEVVGPMDVSTAIAVDVAVRDRATNELPSYLSDDFDLGVRMWDGPSPPVSDGIKRPGEDGFSPSDFVPLTAFYQGDDEAVKSKYEADNARHSTAMDDKGAIDGRWSTNGRCDFCGTRFHYGVAYVHKPSDKLVHVGHICARRANLAPPPDDPSREALIDLSARWHRWMTRRRGSYLFQVGATLEDGLEKASRELDSASRALNEPLPVASNGEAKVAKRVRRWSLGFFGVLLTSAAALTASVFGVFALPFLALGWWIVGVASVLVGFVTRILALMKRLVNLKFAAMQQPADRATQARRFHHYSKELVRLVRARQQFNDWQEVIRTIAHVPFGPGNRSDEVADRELAVACPYPFAYATSDPSADQLQQAQINARHRTITKGWLSGIFVQMKESWRRDYERLLLGEAQEPESDNAPTGTVQARVPGSNEPLYSPRADFRSKVCGGGLHAGVVATHTKEIVDWINGLELNDLLSPVQVSGEGVALSGLGPREFLAGIFDPIEEVPHFEADLFGVLDSALSLRVDNLKHLLPPTDSDVAMARPDIGDLGRAVFFTKYRLALSGPIDLRDMSMTPRVASEPTPPVDSGDAGLRAAKAVDDGVLGSPPLDHEAP